MSNRYMIVTVIQISMVSRVPVINSLALKVSSAMEMTDTMAVSLIREMNWPAKGGSMRPRAWGRMMWRICW